MTGPSRLLPRLLVVLALGAILVPAPVGAQTINDYIYLFADDGAGGFIDCVDGVSIGETVLLHIVLVCSSYPFAHGFECGITLDPSGSLFNASFPIHSVDHGTIDIEAGTADIIAEYGSPLLLSNFTILGQVTLIYLSPDPMSIYLEGSNPSTTPGGLPGYYIDESLTSLPLQRIFDAATPFVMINDPSLSCGISLPKAISTCGPLPDEGLTWGALKSLFR